MDNQELLTQVVVLIKEQSQVVSDMLSEMNNRFINMEGRLDSIENEVKGARLDIENDVTKRIDILFDGYKSANEKQWELEHKTETMRLQIENLEMRILALENKSA